MIYFNFLGKPLARRERDLHWHGEELKCTSPVLATANININLLIVKYKSFPFPGRYHFNNSFTAFPQKKALTFITIVLNFWLKQGELIKSTFLLSGEGQTSLMAQLAY